MQSKSSSLMKVITIAGAFTAYQIGSGFATGQEILQYFVSYGYWGILGAALTLILFAYVSINFMSVGRHQKLSKANDVYRYYCGKHVGMFYDYFSTLFCFLTFSVMVAGAGAALKQHFGLPTIVGGSLIAVLAFVTVIMGLNRIVDIIGKLGPVIAGIAILLGLVSIFSNLGNLTPADVTPLIESKVSEGVVLQASSNWFFAALNYVGFCMLLLGAFMAAIGSETSSDTEVKAGGILGAMLFSGAIMVVALGLMGQLNNVAGTQIPMLVLATDVSPVIASAFSFVIIAGIYTTTAPLLWNVSARITPEGTSKSKMVTAGLTLIGGAIGLFIPFDQLLNVVYVVNGYVGIVLLGFMIVKHMRSSVSVKAEAVS
ncbi:hypothetical protein PsW64_04724 [Pseudovibrio sp. W64]|uniref:YkvI family membrane protein n=1 Tax=Pseudovibrio sp. W64 TaxID=1735583 RepID=UPI0007B1C069|nr:hypothetical protein [Pseudovibrio sp. W64]KZK76879.1 hypothetical protein PsW64_04724 [Pseudovibrio sp. W64]